MEADTAGRNRLERLFRADPDVVRSVGDVAVGDIWRMRGCCLWGGWEWRVGRDGSRCPLPMLEARTERNQGRPLRG